MKWIRLILNILIITWTVFQFQGLEDYLIGTSVSWSFAKVAPYLILILGGILMAFWFRRNVPLPKIPLQILFWIVLVLPFTIGFIINPIYEGDFTKKAKSINKEYRYPDFIHTDLVVIAKPNCPYCHESISMLKLMKERNPNMRIRMVVCDSDPKELEPFKKEIESSFDLQLASNADSVAAIVDYAFPTFVLVKNNLPAQRWSNNQFGVGAKDALEKYFKI
jgi:thiol-disulfide isomerase/thioredoxin